MTNRTEIIFEIFDMVKEPKEIIIFTESFKVKGKLFVEPHKHKNEILTLQDAVVCSHFSDCTCGDNCNCTEGECLDNPPTYKWLNIFKKEIVAFSVIE